jgi:hypothetical protein
VAPCWPKRVVAVVGAGHVPGMHRYWQEVAVEKGPRADLYAAYAPFPPRKYDRRNSWLLAIGLGAIGVGMACGAWRAARAYPGWARQASHSANCCAILTAAGTIGACCFGGENELERLQRKVNDAKEAKVAESSTGS